ncbi:hypothetical protein [Pedobacter sp. L105]|uniref:hypothetical protein n=1 Tax=Pedobacter sp. L105 TaxID=1641871 RepID=UPI00131B5243|nr:hypothetical protein [Pedobacter sp. L105]
MKHFLLLIIGLLWITEVNSQTVTGPSGYKDIFLGDNGQGDYTHSLILLHEIYNGNYLPFNNAVGTVTAYRGATNAYMRIGVAYVNTSSAYVGTSGSVQSLSNDAPWKLKTCMYNGKKYIALDIPYEDAYQNIGFNFSGWSNSTGENLKIVNYMVNGAAVNQTLISNISDFNSDMTETHAVQQMNIMGNVNIGTAVVSPTYQFQVNGKIRAQEVKVETANWPDYVFDKNYHSMPLNEVEQYIKSNKHLPDMPSAKQVDKEGIELGEMNKKLLKKIEELTLYLVDQNERILKQDEKNKAQDKLIQQLYEQMKKKP